MANTKGLLIQRFKINRSIDIQTFKDIPRVKIERAIENE